MIIPKILLITTLLLLILTKNTLAATTVSKTAKDSFKSAAAIYVINRSDIKRSGATNIAEVLRTVPGLQVAQGESDQWMVTSRGFANGFANKLLVMIDGRAIYTSLFSGVYWGSQGVMLENIKQIEVIRGPGATQWGANAVNGVINIITESAANTQSGMASAMYGNNRRSLAARYGGKIKDNSYYRVSASSYDEENKSLNTRNDDIGYTINRGGFRIDYDEFEKDFITLQANIYDGNKNMDLFLPDTSGTSGRARLMENLNIYGGDVIGKWERQISNEEDVKLQLSYDTYARNYFLLSRELQSFDIDFQHSKSLGKIHKVTSGFAYKRVESDLSGNDFRINFNPSSQNTNLYSAFLQDEIAILPNKIFLTIGSKLEHNDFTGYEVQPSIKTSWLLTQDQTIWGSVARATRTPNISENDIKMVVGTAGGGSVYTRQQGDAGFNSEKLIAYELGYRIRPNNDSVVNLALFYNDYDDLRSAERSAIAPPENGDYFASVYPENNGTGKAIGFELDGSIKINKKWELKSAYSYLKLDLDANRGSTDSELEKEQKRSPTHQFNIQSRIDLTNDITFDNMLYYVDEITVTDNLSNSLKVPAYIRFDTHIGWQYSKKISFDFVGQNLFDDSHVEFAGALWSEPIEIGRTFYGKVTLKF
ncbi:MAG: iron complex outermembrane receptor protein [Rickettsiales bacterium]|jgi:iron complex outermembrane receptor protein